MVVLGVGGAIYSQTETGKENLRQIASDAQCTGKKMMGEINRIKEKALGPQGVQYSLRASADGMYPDYRGGLAHLNTGDVWKYGQTVNPATRYTANELRARNLVFTPEVAGNQVKIKVVEKTKIYGYYMVKGHRPPGNPIFR